MGHALDHFHWNRVYICGTDSGFLHGSCCIVEARNTQKIGYIHGRA